MAKKRRTPAQIRAFKKMIAARKASLRKNKPRTKRKNAAGPRKTLARRIKSAIQMKRGDKALAKYVRSGMPSQRNRPKKKKCNPAVKGLTVAQGKRLYELGRRAPKTPVAIKRTRKGLSIVTGKAARKLGSK